MEIQLKPIADQVIVITGASSGIGLATARKAARRGARVVLAARDEQGLSRATRAIVEAGGDAVYCVADTASPDDMRRVAETALREYGTVDTWVNNAGVSIYGALEDTPLEDARRLFDVNYWGMVNGAMTALPILRRGGGALINLGSVVSDRAVPMQGHYSASKHAVKAFSDALRVELEYDGAPVSVTIIKPGSIDTPFPRHARNLMDHEPTLPAPVYKPETVADAILFCAQHPRKSVTVGGGGRAISMMNILSPGGTDKAMRGMVDQQQKDEPTRPGRRDTLYQPPLDNGETRGDYEGRVMRTSAYTKAVLHPGAAALAFGIVAGLGVVLAGATGLLGGRGVDEEEVFELEEEEFAAAAHVEPGDEVGVYAGELEMASDDYADRGVDTLPGGDYGFRSGADQAY